MKKLLIMWLVSLVKVIIIHKILMQSPSSVLMGENWKWRTVNETKKMIQVKHYGSSIDLMKSLKVEYM